MVMDKLHWRHHLDQQGLKFTTSQNTPTPLHSSEVYSWFWVVQPDMFPQVFAFSFQFSVFLPLSMFNTIYVCPTALCTWLLATIKLSSSWRLLTLWISFFHHRARYITNEAIYSYTPPEQKSEHCVKPGPNWLFNFVDIWVLEWYRGNSLFLSLHESEHTINSHKNVIFATFSEIKRSVNNAIHQIWSNPSVKTFRIDWLVGGCFAEVEKMYLCIFCIYVRLEAALDVKTEVWRDNPGQTGERGGREG